MRTLCTGIQRHFLYLFLMIGILMIKYMQLQKCCGAAIAKCIYRGNGYAQIFNPFQVPSLQKAFSILTNFESTQSL